MKLLKSPQKVLILFLSVLIVTSFIMIVRLESKAASLQTQWEKHQESLKNNTDVLMQLESFRRYVEKNLLKMDIIGIDLISDKSWFNVSNNSILIDSNGSLEIAAKGDISIKSLNGDVNINGKKVNLNE